LFNFSSFLQLLIVPAFKDTKNIECNKCINLITDKTQFYLPALQEIARKSHMLQKQLGIG